MSHGVENYFPGLLGMGISDVIFCKNKIGENLYQGCIRGHIPNTNTLMPAGLWSRPKCQCLIKVFSDIPIVQTQDLRQKHRLPE